MSVSNVMFCHYFSSAKNNPTEKQVDSEIQATMNHAPAQKLTEEKM